MSRSTPTPSRVDNMLDDAQLARVELLGRVEAAMNRLYPVHVALRDVWDDLRALERDLAGEDEHGTGGELFLALRALRESRAIRRASWDGQTERRTVAA